MTVGGPCFEPSDVVTCLFDDISTPGIFVNQDSVVCISPALSTVGRVEVILEVIKSNEVVSFQGNGFFYSSRCYYFTWIYTINTHKES